MKINLPVLIGILGGWGVVVAGIASWISKVALERLTSKWRRDEQTAIESVRADLATTAALLQAATSSFAEGHAVSHDRRVDAVERLWSGVLRLRDAFSGPVVFYTVLMPNEYEAVLRRPGGFGGAVDDLSLSVMVEHMRTVEELERDRPQLGETLWLRFFIYRAFLGRLAHLIDEGKRGTAMSDWRDDAGIQQLLGHVLSAETLRAIRDKTPSIGSAQATVGALEGLMLEEISAVISGRRSSLESFENAKELQRKLSSVPKFGE